MTSWHERGHEVFGCVEEYNITSPSFSSFATSDDIDEATVECLAACQSTDECNYWTLDRTANTCELKVNNTGKVATVAAISGEKLCDLEVEVQDEFRH